MPSPRPQRRARGAAATFSSEPGRTPAQPAPEGGGDPRFAAWDPDAATAQGAGAYPFKVLAKGKPLDELLEALDKVQEEMGGAAAHIEARAQAVLTPPDAPWGKENIVGYGITEKRVRGQYTGRLGVTIFVKEKVPKSEIQASAVAPPDVSVGNKVFDTDVQIANPAPRSAVGAFASATDLQQQLRPAPCGSSVGHFRVTAGTLGALVVYRNGGHKRLGILSNNHILANVNFSQIGDNILQPGAADGGQDPGDRIAILDTFVRLVPGGAANFVDAAIAWTKPDLVSPFFGTDEETGFKIDPQPQLDPAIGMRVRKIGRTTGHTLGIITGTTSFPQFAYDPVDENGRRQQVVVAIENQLIIEGLDGDFFSQGGDSGSLIVEADTLRPVGLLFAGDTPGHGRRTYATPLSALLSASELGLDENSFVDAF